MTPIIDVLYPRASNIRVKTKRGRTRTSTAKWPHGVLQLHHSLPPLGGPRGQASSRTPYGSFLCFAGHFQTAPWPIFLIAVNDIQGVTMSAQPYLSDSPLPRYTSAVLVRALEPRSASSDWPQERWSFWQTPDRGFLSLRQRASLTSIRRRRGLFYVPPWTSVCGFAFPCRLRASAKTITEVRTSNLRTRPEGRPNPTLLMP